MISKRLVPLAAMLAAIAVVVAGCTAEQPTTATAGDMLNAQQAFDVAVTWLHNAYPNEAPAADTTWSVEGMVPYGSDGHPLTGAARTRISSPDWVADVTWALLSREFILYDVTLRSPTLGWYWEGTVKAVGGMVSEETGMQVMSLDLASELARQFVVSCDTYMSSGISSTLVMSDAIQGDCTYCWTVTFEFTSKNSGYGDGAGQIVTAEGNTSQCSSHHRVDGFDPGDHGWPLGHAGAAIHRVGRGRSSSIGAGLCAEQPDFCV